MGVDQESGAIVESTEKTRKLQKYQARAFVLTWFSYASYYMTRKPIGVVKARLQDELGMSIGMLGLLDTAYLSVYAIGQFINGLTGDRIGSRRLLSFGMWGTAACAALFGLNSFAALLLFFWAMNGFFQSSGWPGNVKAMTPWFGVHKRGTIMGLWGTCYQVGGIVGTGLASFIIVRWGWRAAFLTPAIWVVLVATAIYFLMVNHPRDVDLRSPADLDRPDDAPLSTEITDDSEEKPMSLREAFRLPGIINLGAAYFCLKLIRYTLLFWLPFYLTKKLGYAEDTAGYLSTSFEAGGIAGAIIIGWLSDKYAAGRRVIFAAPMVLLIGGGLLLYQVVGGWGMAFNAGAMAIVGFLLFGPDSLLSGAAAQDLGGPRAAASAAGIINGLGSIGAALQGVVTAQVTERFGWGALFYTLMGLSTLAFFILLPLVAKDIKKSRPGASTA